MHALRWLIVGAFAAAMTAPAATAEAPKQIVCTTFPIYLFTRNIVEGHHGVSVDLLVPPGTGCPHDYTITPQDLQKAAEADAVVINGLGLDDALADSLREVNPDFELMDSSDGVDELLADADGHCTNHAHEHGHNHGHGETCTAKAVYNPHLFASPAMAAKVVENIAEKLTAWDPDAEAVYRRNAKEYAAELRSLAHEMQRATEGLANPRIVTQHDIFDYLARYTSLEIAAHIQAHPGQEPSASEMVELAKAIREKDAGAVLTEPQYSDAIGQTLGAEMGLPVATLDPAATGPADAPLDYYQRTMRNNIKTLQETLGVKPVAP